MGEAGEKSNEKKFVPQVELVEAPEPNMARRDSWAELDLANLKDKAVHFGMVDFVVV